MFPQSVRRTCARDSRLCEGSIQGTSRKSVFPQWLAGCRGVFVVFGIVLLAGCGRSGPEVVKVDGQVTYGGGAWPRPGAIYFLPVKSGAADSPDRPGSAQFDADGRFSPMSYKPGDGLCPGKYQVYVQCWTVEPVQGGAYPPSHVPPKYQSAASSGLEVTVPSGQRSMEVKLDIPKK